MTSNYSQMIPGAAAEGELEVVAPFDLAPIATVETSGAGAAEQALANAYALFRNRSGWLPLHRRAEILERATEIMAARREELAIGAAREGGKPLVDSLIEVDRAIDGVKLCIEVMRGETGEVIPMGGTAGSAHRVAFTRREPIGVVVAVSAFNHPLNLIVHQVAPAVATGCPVVVKPSNDTPLSCLAFVSILHEAGLPPEWCQPVVTATRAVSEQLVTDDRVAFFSFIGSAPVGWSLRSKLAHGTRAALEHGGAAPLIVAGDANLERAVQSVTKGGFYHAGQVCVSVQRVFAHKDVAENFAGQLADRAAGLVIGDPVSVDTEVGPLIRPREVERVAQWVDEAREGGAAVLSGGKARSETCYECTVLTGPAADARVSTQEIFGPVVCVYEYDDIDEAIERANALPVAFQAAVFTQDIDVATHVYSNIDASAVMVNDHTAFRVDGMPFAGLRQSGLGVGGIPYTMHEMSIEKMMVINSPAL